MQATPRAITIAFTLGAGVAGKDWVLPAELVPSTCGMRHVAVIQLFFVDLDRLQTMMLWSVSMADTQVAAITLGPTGHPGEPEMALQLELTSA